MYCDGLSSIPPFVAGSGSDNRRGSSPLYSEWRGFLNLVEGSLLWVSLIHTPMIQLPTGAGRSRKLGRTGREDQTDGKPPFGERTATATVTLTHWTLEYQLWSAPWGGY